MLPKTTNLKVCTHTHTQKFHDACVSLQSSNFIQSKVTDCENNSMSSTSFLEHEP